MTRVSLTLLGGFQVRSDTGALGVTTRKTQALLAYLALPAGRAHPRDKLAALLWGDTADEQARASLRQALYALRKVLPAGSLPAEGDTVALDPRGVDVDVASFERGVAEGTPEALTVAAALYQGDLLAGLALNEAPFEEWLLGERERLRELALEGLAKLLAHQRASGAAEAAVQTALRLLTMDLLQEPVHRTLMRLYAQLGRRGAALRQYQHCVAVLQRELGVEPETQTKQLYQEILRQRPAPRPTGRESRVASATSPAVPTRAERAPAETPLIGRQSELACLRAALDEACRGQGGVVAVLGEAGVGKSRLVEELAAEGRARGALVLIGRSYESEQILPFGPWADAVRKGQVLDEPNVLDGVGPVWRAELARLFPELAGLGLLPASDAADQLRLFEAVVHLFAHLAARQPLVLILEDLHWADEMSVRLLSFLGRRIQASRVLLVGTAREEELAGAVGLRPALQELAREQRLAELPLLPLSQPDTVALVRALAKAGTEEPIAARLGERVWRTSRGNPFVIVESMRALRDEPLEGAGAVPLPRRVRDVIAGRLERLSDRGQRLAAVAAVIGREFDFSLLQHAAGLGEDEAAKGLEELVRRRVLSWMEQRFDFAHDRIRDVAYSRLLPPHRKLLHGSVARALEALYTNNLEPHYGALAVHYREAGVWDEAVGYLTRVAERAARAYAHTEAMAALQEALGLVERLPAEDRDSRLIDLVLRQAGLLHYLGRFSDILDLLLQQRERLERLGNASLSGHCFFLLAQAHSVLGDRERATETATRALKEANRCGDEAAMGKAHTVLAREAYWVGQPLQGVEHSRQAVTLLQRTNERHWLGIAHWLVGRGYGLMGEFEAAFEAEAQAQAIGEETGDLRLQSHVAWTTGDLQAIRGEWETAVATCDRALALSPDPLNTANALGHLGSAYLEKGDPARAIPYLEQSLQEFGQFRAGQARGWFTIMLGEAYLLSGQLEKARDVTAQGQELLQHAEYRRGIAWARRTLGRIAHASGAFAEAETHLTVALETFVSILARFEVARTHLALAELANARGNPEAVATHLGEAQGLFRTLRIPKYVERTEQAARAFARQISGGNARSRSAVEGA